MDLLQYCYCNIYSDCKAILLFNHNGSAIGVYDNGLYVIWRWRMRAITCTMIGFIIFYIAGHTKKDAIMLRGAYLLAAHIFLALAIILMILGK